MELERVAARARRRHRSWLPIAGAIAIVAGAASELRSPAEVQVVTLVRDKVVTVPMTVPLLITELAPPPPPTPVVLPAQRGARAVCPPPRRDAPMVALPEFDDSMIEHVVPAPTNAGWIAAWGGSTVYVSYDAGAHFSVALGPDDGGSVDDVTFDCHGRVVILASGKLALFADGKLTWLYDYRDEFAGVGRTLIGGGPDIAIVRDVGDYGAAVLEVSHDLGTTWSYEEVWSAIVDRRNFRATGRQAADGTIRLVLTADSGDLTERTGETEVRAIAVRGDDVRQEPVTITRGDVERYGTVDLDAGAGGAASWRRGGGDWQRVEGLPRNGLVQLVPGPWPAVVVDGGLYLIERGKARRVLDWPAEKGRTSTEPATIDLAGRVWAIESRGGGDCDGTFEPVLLGRVAR